MRYFVFFDAETFSLCDLKVAGAYRYLEDPTTGFYCVCLGVADKWGGEFKKRLYSDPESTVPRGLRDLLGRPDVAWIAHNVAFEWAFWVHHLMPRGWGPPPPVEQWFDTQALGCAVNLPASLEGLGAALGLEIQKDLEGAKLMKRMATYQPEIPHRLPGSREERLRLREYCWLDVETTAQAFWKLPQMGPDERAAWKACQSANRRGVMFDDGLVDGALELMTVRRRELEGVVDMATGGACTVTGVPGLKKWVASRGVALPTTVRRTKKGVSKTDDLSKSAIAGLLKTDIPADVRQVLEARAESGKLTSLSKLDRAKAMASIGDRRVRSVFRFCGASTGRWSSHGVQLHNLPKNQLGGWTPMALEAVRSADMEGLRLLGGSPLEAMSNLLRSTVIAGPGKDLIAADYSAIEARVLAWLAGQQDVLDVFRAYDSGDGVDVYVYTAQQLGSDDRQYGKVARLALGYGMGDLKFFETAADWGYPISLKAAREGKLAFRDSAPHIVGFWNNLDETFRVAIQDKGVRHHVAGTPISMFYDGYSLRIMLPSGRGIYYHRPSIARVTRKFKVVEENSAGEMEVVEKESEVDEIRFYGPEGSRMVAKSTYGGKLAENVTQAVARDLLADALVRMEAHPTYSPVLHVHDSLACEVDSGQGNVEEFEELLQRAPDWAEGLPNSADGYRASYFKG